MKKNALTLQLIVLGGLTFLLFGLGSSLAGASNNAYGDGTYNSCTYDACPITLTSSGTVNVNVLPAAGTTCTIQSDAVGVTTDSSTGYTLTVNDNDTNNSLVNGASSITAISASQASPAVLSANRWGYRVDAIGGFGSGPTTASSNISPPGTTFAPVPPSNLTADTLATAAAAADPAVTTTVWYGVCADISIPAGTYSDSVVYTAVIN
jgi:hypothetical protein